MKTKLFLTVVVLGMTLGAQATIWRVNNDPNAGADFAQLQEANDDASVMPGDTIHMEHSSVLYDAATINKQLVIIGTGYFLAENFGQQYVNTAAIIDNTLILGSGSEGSVLLGVDYTNLYVRADDIRIENCQGQGVQIDGDGITTGGTRMNIVVRHNIISGDIGTINAINASNISVVGNICNSIGHTGPGGLLITGNYCNTLYVKNSICRNNIIKSLYVTGTSPWSSLFNSSANVVEYNVIEQNAPSDLVNSNLGSNNIFGQPMSTVINSSGGLSALGDETNFELIPGSPAIGAGFNGVDCGPWAAGYVLAGTPDVPSVYFLNAGPTGTQNGLNVTFSTRSNP